MGSGASRTDDANFEFGAFLEAKQEYETNVAPLLSNAELSYEQALSMVRDRFISAANNGQKGGDGAIVTPPEIPQVHIGDIVKVKDNSMNSAFYFEGVVIQIENGMALVNFGDDVVSDNPEDIQKEFPLSDCILVLGGLELEMEDHVEVKTIGNLYCSGTIVNIHRKFVDVMTPIEVTYDVHFDGDPEDVPDIEKYVTPDRIRKVISNRVSAAERWRRGFIKVQAAAAFKKSGKDRVHRVQAKLAQLKKEQEEAEAEAEVQA